MNKILLFTCDYPELRPRFNSSDTHRAIIPVLLVGTGAEESYLPASPSYTWVMILHRTLTLYCYMHLWESLLNILLLLATGVAYLKLFSIPPSEEQNFTRFFKTLPYAASLLTTMRLMSIV